MGYDSKGIRVPDLGEAGICLGLARGGGGSRRYGLGGYDSRSDIFGSKRPGSPGKTRTDKGAGSYESMSLSESPCLCSPSI